ncbi:MAG: hypothetical protein JNL90_18690 [Planctomycetes bacterium]|nr:hypothetical protein [Planctomycetota bacterium]
MDDGKRNALGGARIGMAGAAALLAAGCGGGGGGGGGGGAVTGLSAPSQLSVVTPSDDGNSSSLHALDVADFPSDADYFADGTTRNVYDPSTQPISTVNGILCMLKQTRYNALVNRGNYLAQVDQEACGMGDGDDSDGQSSGGAAQLSNWVVNSRRANSNAAQLVRFWVPQGDHTIRGKLRINDGVSDANPFGRFQLDFAAVDNVAPDIDAATMFGSLKTIDVLAGYIGYEFFENDGDVNVAPQQFEHAQTVQAAVNMTADRTAGVARIRTTYRNNFPPMGDSGIQTEEFLVAFDETHLLRQKDGGAELAFARGDFDERAWRYNLYHASGPEAGERVELNSGFPFRAQDGEFGHLGYWGIWSPSGAQFQTGDIIERLEFGSDATTAYSLVVAPGRLSRYLRDTINLNELGGTTFEYVEFDGMNPPVRYQVEYSSGQFQKLAQWDEMDMEFVDLGSPVAIDTATLGFVNFFSPTLGGPVFYKDGDTFVTAYQQSFVGPDDALFGGNPTVNVYGYLQCLQPDVSQASAEMGDIYLPDATDPASPVEYVLDRATMQLYHGSTVPNDPTTSVAGLALGETVTSGPYTWGMRSGPMVASTSGFTSVYDILDANEFFVWETGPNPWNQWVGALDGNGDAVTFDPPLQFAYVHSQANDRNDDPTFDGATFVLQYGGPGELHGLPYDSLDLDGDTVPDRWYPLANLADGILVGPTGVEYVVKAIEVEQNLVLDGAGAPQLNLGGAAILALPDGSSYVAPDNGDTPVVTDAPAVIAGELQGDLQALEQ